MTEKGVAQTKPQTNLKEVPIGADMIKVGDGSAPKAPSHLDETGIEPEFLADLTLRYAYTVPYFTSEKASKLLCLPQPMVSELLEGLKNDKLVEKLGAAGPLDYRFAITEGGRDRARRLIEITTYVGPAPVSLEAYTTIIESQLASMSKVSPEHVAEAISELVLSDEAIQVAALAGLSGRSLFVFGPPGNGKTTLGHLLHGAVEGDLWIPHCIGIENSIIRVFDPRVHQRSSFEVPQEEAHGIDRRWVRVRRPFVVVGGELTIEDLDLGFSPSLGYYEAPLHFKANGGTFLLDDLGFQHIDPQELLARWIFPLENGIDYLTLQTGQKLEVPFRQKLIVSTNIDPEKVMNPAFLRRMGYRLYLGDPSPEYYVEIFRRYAGRYDLTVSADHIAGILDRYKAEGRPLRSCEPRDLIERVRDVCMLRDRKVEINEETLDVAWRGYFGNKVGTDW
jgi:predicted ATPase with chaperone activity